MIYFGDIHNHNGVGYGQGSLERSIEIARSHLDFFAFTGHSSWHDMPHMDGGREQIWVRGFERLEESWPQVQRMTAEANRDGSFVTLLGFEWHSSRFGDQCVLFPDDYRPRTAPNDLDALRMFCLENGALMIPHHLGYPTGHRGVNWDVFSEECTPVVEVFSEHGSAVDDRDRYAYFNHAMGPRVTANTAMEGLRKGFKFGFTASSDSHSGFPGGWDEGITGVLAEKLTRAAIFEAIQSRRTYALTGDRIEVRFEVDQAPMGSEIGPVDQVHAVYQVDGLDEIEFVEIVQDGRVVHRSPANGVHRPQPEPRSAEPYLVRLEWGWGPWAAMGLDRTVDWDFSVGIDRGEIHAVYPCFRSGPFDELRRHEIVTSEPDMVRLRSYSGRQRAYRGNPNHSVVLKIDGAEKGALRIDVESPCKTGTRVEFEALLDSGRPLLTGPYPDECMLVHRPVPFADYRVEGEVVLDTGQRPSNAFLRVVQRNGQMAWASPIFMNYR